MEISVKREALSEAFSIAQSVATARSTRPVLQNALLTASAEGLSVAATDMEIGITWKISAEDCRTAKEGVLLLPAARMAQIARSVEAADISLKSDKTSCTVRAGRSVFNVLTENAEDFPAMPALPSEAALEIEAEKFASMTRKTIFAAARESTRYALNGVHMQVEAGVMEMVATDGRRMALMKEKLGGKVDMPAAIVPQKALAQVEKLKAAAGESLKVFIQERQIFFATASGVVVSRLVEGHFPPYRDVLPKETDKKMTVSRATLLSAMRQAAIMTSEASKSVSLAFASGELTVTGTAPDEGHSEVKLDVTYEGEPLDMRFNPLFIIDALTASTSEDITIDMKEAGSPALLKDGSGFMYVVMPIHIV